MNEDDKSNTIRSEWTLLLNSFIDDNEKVDQKGHQKLKEASQPAFHNDDYAKNLSLTKHHLYQKIEEIKAQIDETTQIIENLKLVGSDTDGLDKALDDLHKQGEIVSLEIQEIDHKIKKIRRSQDKPAQSA